MSLTAKIIAMLDSLTRNQIQALPPIERRQLQDQCDRVLREVIHADAREATARRRAPIKAGALLDLERSLARGGAHEA